MYLLFREEQRIVQSKQFISLSLEEIANLLKQWVCCLRGLSKRHMKPLELPQQKEMLCQ